MPADFNDHNIPNPKSKARSTAFTFALLKSNPKLAVHA